MFFSYAGSCDSPSVNFTLGCLYFGEEHEPIANAVDSTNKWNAAFCIGVDFIYCFIDAVLNADLVSRVLIQ